MSKKLVYRVALVCLLGLLSSGCAIPGLKEANQRLKEQNDRLVSENNRLEQELASFRGGGAEAEAGGGFRSPDPR